MSRPPPGSLGAPLVGEAPTFLKDPFTFTLSRTKQHGNIWKTRILSDTVVFFAGPRVFSFFMDSENFTPQNGSPKFLQDLLHPDAALIQLLMPVRTLASRLQVGGAGGTWGAASNGAAVFGFFHHGAPSRRRPPACLEGPPPLLNPPNRIRDKARRPSASQNVMRRSPKMSGSSQFHSHSTRMPPTNMNTMNPRRMAMPIAIFFAMLWPISHLMA